MLFDAEVANMCPFPAPAALLIDVSRKIDSNWYEIRWSTTDIDWVVVGEAYVP